MKKNREIDLAEPVKVDNYHSLEVRLARGSLEDKAKGNQCFSLTYVRTNAL